MEPPVSFASYDPHREGIPRLMRATPRAASGGTPAGIPLVDGLQNCDDGGLDARVFQGRDASRSLPPIGLRKRGLPGGLRSVCAFLEPFGKALEVALQGCAVLLPRHAIDTGCRLRIEVEVRAPSGLETIDMGKERGTLPLPILPCCLTYPFQVW